MKEKSKIIIPVLIFVICTVVLFLLIPVEKRNELHKQYGKLAVNAETDEKSAFILENVDQIPKDILDLYYRDTEKWIDYVYNYPAHKDDYKIMRFTDEEINSESVPALSMRDTRWSYEKIGNGYIAEYGCLPTCLTMAYLYLTHSPDVDPYIISRIAEEIDAIGMTGITDDRVKDLASEIGLEVTEHKFYSDIYAGKDSTITAEELKAFIDSGNVIIGGMYGDVFGIHAIVFSDYNDEGFRINDPANQEYTDKVWKYEEFEPELYFLYEISLKK